MSAAIDVTQYNIFGLPSSLASQLEAVGTTMVQMAASSVSKCDFHLADIPRGIVTLYNLNTQWSYFNSLKLYVLVIRRMIPFKTILEF